MEKIPVSAGRMPEVFDATRIFREILEQSSVFSKYVGEKLSVNRTDFEAMEHLIENGPMAAGDLAQAVSLTPGAATVMIDRLVNLGHVTRVRNPADRRGVLVVPNPDSTSRAWALIHPLIQASETATAEMPEEQRAAVTKYLTHMLNAYKSLVPNEQN